MNTSNKIKEFGRVLVLMGGESAEREVSLDSGKNVLESLQNQGIEAHALDVKHATLAEDVLNNNVDRVFNVLHGRGGEDGLVQGVLEAIGVPYTGTGVLGSALSMDKKRSKWLWQGIGIPTLPFAIIESADEIESIAKNFSMPLCIKPTQEGSSIGVKRVDKIEDLKKAYQEAKKSHCEVMLEPWIDGEEYTVGILNNQALPVIRIETPRDFYDYTAKYNTDSTEYLIPSGLNADDERYIQELSLDAFEALGCEYWGRVDMMRDNEGEFWLLEANTIPGFTAHSLVPQAAKALGISFDQFVLQILQQTLD